MFTSISVSTFIIYYVDTFVNPFLKEFKEGDFSPLLFCWGVAANHTLREKAS